MDGASAEAADGVRIRMEVGAAIPESDPGILDCAGVPWDRLWLATLALGGLATLAPGSGAPPRDL